MRSAQITSSLNFNPEKQRAVFPANIPSGSMHINWNFKIISYLDRNLIPDIWAPQKEQSHEASISPVLRDLYLD